eukprot:XP_014056580.1 PREDICTED: DC-STAMP domain-containing protein 2-like isoform X2 [Salmo salar]
MERLRGVLKRVPRFPRRCPRSKTKPFRDPRLSGLVHSLVKGKNFLLFFIFSMLVQGPMTNTLENFDRAADSVVCGAELAMNQTQQLVP